MNLTKVQLRAQYEGARPLIGELVDAAEKAFSLPSRVLWAVYSRETNLDPYYLTHAGDAGHGRGVGQVDDRSHTIPGDWATNLAWQVGASAEIFASCLTRANGDVVKAANRYNSGQEKSENTTGEDYGPDVFERWRFLQEMFPPVREEFQIVQCVLNMNGLCLDVSGQSLENGAAVVQWACNGQPNQGVSFEEIGRSGDGQVVRIRFDHSGKYLDLDPNRLELVQWERAEVSGQLWLLEKAPQDLEQSWQPVGTRITSIANGHVVDVEGISDQPGAKVIHWPWNGQINQQFLVAHFR